MKPLLVLIYIFSLSACGIKGKPLPPLKEEPLPSVEAEKVDTASATTTVKPLKTLPVKKKNK